MKKFIFIGLFLISAIFGAMNVQADTIKDTDGNTVSSENTYYVRIKPLVSGIPDYYWINSESMVENWTLLTNEPTVNAHCQYKFEKNGTAYKIYSVDANEYLWYFHSSIFYPNGGIDTGARAGSINWTFTSVGNNTYSFKADDGNIYARISSDTADLTTAVGSAGYNYYSFQVQFVKVK